MFLSIIVSRTVWKHWCYLLPYCC